VRPPGTSRSCARRSTPTRECSVRFPASATTFRFQELFDLAASAPADTGRYRSRILALQQTGDAAFATVAEEGYWGTVSFIDYLSLAKIGGTWKIVNKLFAHTGGEPPEMG
jgi:hypothetical protein